MTIDDATLRALCEAELAGLPTWREAVHALLDRVAEAGRRAEEAEGKLARLQEDAIDIHERANRAEAKLAVAVAALEGCARFGLGCSFCREALAAVDRKETT